MNLRKLWLVAWNTYRQQVRSTLFLIMTFALPVLSIGAGMVTVLMTERVAVIRLGWVDQTGALALPPDQPELILTPFEDQAHAAQALEAEAVDAYLVIPAGYLEGASPAYHGRRSPNESALAALRLALRHALAPDAPAWLYERLGQSAVWEFRDLDTGVALRQGIELTLWGIAPFALGLLYVFMLLTTINHMGPAIVREKEDRAMEMVLTSLRPVELVGGKILGLSLLTLTQAAVWGLGAAVAIGLVWSQEGGVGIPRLPWGSLLWGAALAAPCYLLYGALGAGLGILAGDREQATQFAGLFALLGVAPIWLISLIFAQPDSLLAVALTLVPVFAPTMALFRMTMTAPPAWQLWAALGLLLASLVVALWLTARLFRAAALLYGQRLALREIWRALAAR